MVSSLLWRGRSAGFQGLIWVFLAPPARFRRTCTNLVPASNPAAREAPKTPIPALPASQHYPARTSRTRRSPPDGPKASRTIRWHGPWPLAPAPQPLRGPGTHVPRGPRGPGAHVPRGPRAPPRPMGWIPGLCHQASDQPRPMAGTRRVAWWDRAGRLTSAPKPAAIVPVALINQCDFFFRCNN